MGASETSQPSTSRSANSRMTRAFAPALAVAAILLSSGEAATADDVKMRVVVHNDTEKRKLPREAEAWVRGLGSWWLQGATKFGADFKDVALINDPKNTDHMLVYPDGRNGGTEVKIPYQVSGDLCTNACVRDSLCFGLQD